MSVPSAFLNFVPAREMDGLYSCLDYFLAVDDPFSKELQVQYNKKFSDTKYPLPPPVVRPACIAASNSTKRR
jgi:hypothetical protein